MLVFYQVSYLQYALLLHLMFVFFLLPPFPLSQIPCFSPSHPHTSALPAYVLNKSHQHTLKYSSSVLLIYFGMQQTPKAPLPFFFFYMVILAAVPPENHLCFISFTCLSLGLWRFSQDGRQSTVCSISGREGY